MQHRPSPDLDTFWINPAVPLARWRRGSSTSPQVCRSAMNTARRSQPGHRHDNEYRKLGLPMIKFFSRLPMRALYAFSTFLYLLAFYVVRHRHAVIREQIEKVFPDWSGAEREALHKQYLK